MNSISSIISILIFLIHFPFAKEMNIEKPISKLPKPVSIKTFTIEENDTTIYQVNLALDSLNQPLYYFRNIFTPVCYTNKCHPVYINFYWDLLGNFIEYDFPPDKILTKVDHDPFQDEDYKKLLDILSNKNSLLKAYKMEELVDTKSLNNGVDAVTGATLKTIKNEVIDGAVYTCYTLWHIANGEVKSEISKITEGITDKTLLSAFLESDNHYYHYYAIDKIFGQPDLFERFEELILQRLSGDNIFLSKYILENFPGDLLIDAEVQEELVKIFNKVSYNLQIEMLEKFSTIQFSQEALKLLSESSESENFKILEKKTKVFSVQKELPKEVQIYLSNCLESNDYRISELAYKTLIDIQPEDKSIRKKMDHFIQE